MLFFRLKLLWNKQSGRYTTYEVKEDKTYAHLIPLVATIFRRQLASQEGMYKPVTWSDTDPRRLGVLAPESPPPTCAVAALQKSRMK